MKRLSAGLALLPPKRRQILGGVANCSGFCRCLLFGFLPFLKIKHAKRDVISIFGLPLFRGKTVKGKKIVRFLNLIPVLKIN